MDTMISLGQKNTLAEYMILSGADNRPPMLDKDLTKKYAELSAAEKIQADYDMKATNIILQDLPADIYSLMNHHRVAKDLWAPRKILLDIIAIYWLINDYEHSTRMKYWSNFKLIEVLNQSSTDIGLITYQSPQAPMQLMTESPFVDLGFAILMFSPRDDLIACLNKAMAFLTAVASSRGDKGKIILVQHIRAMLIVQGEIQQVDKQELLNATTAKKAMLPEAQEAGQILDEEQLAFLDDPGIPAYQVQTIIPHNDAFQTEDLDTYDSYFDDLSTAQAVLMANISNYGSDVISEVPNSETYLNDMDNQSVHALQDFEQSPVMDFTDNEISSDSNIIPYSQYLQETQQATVQDTNLQAQQDSMILSVIEQISREKMIDSQMDDMIREKLALKEQIDSLEQNLSKQIKEKESLFKTFIVFKNESKEKENKYMENEIDLEKKIKELDNIVYKVVDVPSELPKVSLVNASLKKLKFHLTQFDSVVKKRTTPSALEEGEWGFEHTKAIFNNEIIPFLKSLKDIFNVFDKDLLNEITEVQTVFDQMEASVQQFSVDKKCLEIAKKEILLENDRLLQKIMSQDVLLTVINSMSWNNDSVNIEMQTCDSCEKCLNINVEISKSKQAYNDLLKNYSQLEKHSWLQDKDMTICKLKDTIRSLSKNTKEENVNHDKWKEIVENVVHIPSANTIAPGMFKLDLEPLPPRLLQNREVHITYLRNTQEQANILQELVKQAKAKQPLDGDLDLACKYAIRIQELLVYVQDTCPNAITNLYKKVAVTPMNNVKKVKFAKPLTSSSNIKQHSLSKANSEILYATCNKSMFDGVHDKCLLDIVQNGNNLTKSSKKHRKQNVWKPTGHVFTEVGFK
ncbi:hypothetical protein Tco_1263098 [Tanacetum coccineum]